MMNKIMKKLVCSLSRFLLDVAFLMAVFFISNGCTKISEENNPGPPPPSKYDVSISGVFSPSELIVTAGTIVTWVNNYYRTQSVTSDDGFFDGIVSTSETYSYKFEFAGSYTYHSRMNPNMIGKVVVY
jgi:plastocyanin